MKLLPTGVLTPDYKIMLKEQDITQSFAKRLISLNLIDNSGFEADSVTITIDDADGKVELPKTGVKLDVFIGFKERLLIDKGTFVVDSITHSGAPDVIEIGAKSADFREKFIEQRNHAYHNKTIEEIVKEIAVRYEYKTAISESLKAIKITDLQQSNESDANLLTRLAIEYDAVATIKKGTLLFLEAGSGKTAGGQELPEIVITRRDGDKHSYQVNDRNAYTGVIAKYNDAKGGRRKQVTFGKEDKTKMLRTTFRNEDEAMRAAEKEMQRLERGKESFNFFLAIGQPETLACSPVKVMGFKKDIDEKEWIATRVIHSLGDNGLTTQVEAEVNNKK